MLANPQEMRRRIRKWRSARSAEAAFQTRKRPAQVLGGFEGWRGVLPICDLGFCSTQSRLRPRNHPELRGPCQNRAPKAAKPPRTNGVAQAKRTAVPGTAQNHRGSRRGAPTVPETAQNQQASRHHWAALPACAAPRSRWALLPVARAKLAAPLLTVALNRGNIGSRRACQLLR